MDGELFQELDALTQRISRLSPSREDTFSAMLRQVNEICPDFPKDSPISIEEFARLNLAAVASIPFMVDLLKLLLERPDCDPAWRYALVLPLVYLVRSDDLCPDDLEGGYGYVDDYIALRAALSYALTNNALLGWVVQVLQEGQEQRDSMWEMLSEWIADTPQVTLGLLKPLPVSRSASLSNLYFDIKGTYEKCAAWLAVDPGSLEHRTQQLIDNPRLPGPVLTHPVEDKTVWQQWEWEQADQRRKAMTESEHKMREAAYKLKWLDELERRQMEKLRNPVKAVYFPGGGGVLADDHHVYVIRK